MKVLSLIVKYTVNLAKRNVSGRRINVSKLEVGSEEDVQRVASLGFVGQRGGRVTAQEKVKD